jgi:hypothetical protein
MNFNLSQYLPIPWIVPAYLIGTVVVHIGFAIAVGRDALRLRREAAGPLIAGPFLWTLATLIGGVFVAGLYWVVNHSALSRR